MKRTLPEFIDTNLQNTRKHFRIPTDPRKELRSDRRDIIRDAYQLLLSKLGERNYIKNEFLNKSIYIIWKESFQKATNNATRNWQTTYAVLKYVELIKLRYTFNNKKLDHMNFTIELVIGVKKDGKHVQYSLEYIKKACS